MSIYEWVFCYVGGKYEPKEKRNYPWKVRDKEILIDRRKLEGWVLKFANEYLSNKIDLKKLLDVILDNPTELGLWYTTMKLYEILFGKFPIRDNNAQKLIERILNREDLSPLERVLYGISYLFAYNRLKILEKGLFGLLFKKKVYVRN